MMKITLALLLFGFTGVLTSPSCSEEEFAKCSGNVDLEESSKFGSPQTEEALDELCSQGSEVVDCQLDFIERCPNAGYGSKEVAEEFKRLFGILCDRSNHLRKKFMDNSRCLSETKKEIRNVCNIEENMVFMGEEKDCGKLRELMECVEESVAERCGEDAKEAFLAIRDPDHQLRSNKCV